MHYYSFHIGDYRADTAHLSNEEDLAYRRLLDMYYDTEKPIPTDTQWVSRRIRIASKIVETVLQDMFEFTVDGWRKSRCDEEIKRYHGNAEKNRVNGSKGGRPKNPMGYQSQPTGKATNNHKPITINQEPDIKPKRTAALVKPDSVAESIWSDFVAMRKAKRAPLTQTALNGIAAEANKAGIPLESALEICCSRGWQGFKADWLIERAGNGGRLTQQQRIDANNKQAIEQWLAESEGGTHD